ncbi:hypothetical protein [Kitasatospora purpeofusca]|uniref:hypothetical protein n=1 Tax=Kitasatospora purpeofusca TaxID=67352 RepID=UPI0035E09A6A
MTMPDIDLDIEADAALSTAGEQAAERLLALAYELQVEDVDLDEAVHHAAATYGSTAGQSIEDENDTLIDDIYDEAGRQAAEVNNGGLPDQVRYLVVQYGTDRAEEIIRAAG